MLRFYSQGRSIQELSKILKRDEKTIKGWLDYKNKMPWWVPEILRLYQMEQADIRRQIFQSKQYAKLGIVKDNMLLFPNVSPHRQTSPAKTTSQQAGAAPILKKVVG